MRILQMFTTAGCFAALIGSAHAQTAPAPEAVTRYAQRIGGEYQAFAGSMTNLESLAGGLRYGSEVTLTQGADTVAFVPPTKPMGYGSVTHALNLANRQLMLAGVTQPTPEQIAAAMMGGTVTTPDGEVELQGVLQLRSQRMGWGQIAHAIGVHPSTHARALGVSSAARPSGITSALGGTMGTSSKGVRGHASGEAERGSVRASGTGATVAAGSIAGAPARSNGSARGARPSR